MVFPVTKEKIIDINYMYIIKINNNNIIFQGMPKKALDDSWLNC